MTADRKGPYATIAGLLAYPDAESRQRLDRCRDQLDLDGSTAAAHLADFDGATRDLDRLEAEELYTRTFDLNPPCALEIGWHLFGEDYHRGAILVRLREELARHGIEESCELPDHLVHVLPLIDRMAPEEAARFVPACVTPAVMKIIAALKGRQNPYEHLLRCLVAMLVAEFGEPETVGFGGGLPVLADSDLESSPSCHDCQEPVHEPSGI